jgi:hypothetical protein
VQRIAWAICAKANIRCARRRARFPRIGETAMFKIEVEDGNGIWSEVRGADGTPPGEQR